MFTLVALGTGTAYLYSVVATLAPGLFPEALRGHGGAVPAYFEAAAVITVLVLLGQVLELRARESTGGALRALLDLAPKTARRIRPDGEDEEVQLDAIGVGDRLRVRPGEKVPVDGAVVEGRGSVDESLVTGESMPVAKEAGAPVIGGSLNQSGSLVVEATKVGARHHAGPHRPDGGRGPAEPGPDPAPRRPGRGLVRAGGHRRGGSRLRRLDGLRAGAPLHLRAVGRGGGADHRLPVRARPRHADVDHGRRRPRRRAGCSSRTRRRWSGWSGSRPWWSTRPAP